jgi:hypothetical protein
VHGPREALHLQRPRVEGHRATSVDGVAHVARRSVGPEDGDRARVRPLEAEVEGDPVAEVRDAIRGPGTVPGGAGIPDERRQRVVHRGEHPPGVGVVGGRDEPPHVQRDDEIDEGVVACRGEAAFLYGEPAARREVPDLVGVVLVVAAVVLRDAEDEPLARQTERGEGVVPRVGDHGREARVLALREDDVSAARPEHVRE